MQQAVCSVLPALLPRALTMSQNRQQCVIYFPKLYLSQKIFPAQFVALNSDQRVSTVWNTMDLATK